MGYGKSNTKRVFCSNYPMPPSQSRKSSNKQPLISKESYHNYNKSNSKLVEGKK
jgi:hypothetical protein